MVKGYHMKEGKPRHVAGEKLLAVYAKLTHFERLLLQEMLLQHAFLPVRTGVYINWNTWNSRGRISCYVGLMKHISVEAAEAWYDWAAAITAEHLSPKALREVIVDFVGQLVVVRVIELK
jgi:hypothetical protein